MIFPVPRTTFPEPPLMTAPVSPVSDDLPPSEDVAAPPAPALPDRADAPVSEVSERFLRAVMAEIPLDRLEELHMFSPLRQGTVETGIAVLAVRVPVIVAESVPAPADGPSAPELALDDQPVDAAAELTFAAPDEHSDEQADEHADEHAETPTGEQTDDLADTAAVEMLVDEASDDEDVSSAGELVAEASDEEQVEAAATAIDATEIDPPASPARPVRHTVYTARYRYVIKGPERGKWEANVKAEADAPLVTVETVVRGVQRRAGEESEIIRYSAAQIAKILRVPYPAERTGE